MLRDLRDAWRNLRRSPGTVVVVVATLTVGVGCNTLIFSLVDQALLRPLPVRYPDRLVSVFTADFSGTNLGTSSFPDFLDFSARAHTLEDLAAFAFTKVQLGAGDEAVEATAELVTGNYFGLLGVEAVLGRTFDAAAPPGQEATGETVLSWSTWKQRFDADPEVVGKTVEINGNALVIIGVAPRGFRGLLAMSQPDLWVPMAQLNAPEVAGGAPRYTSRVGLDRLLLRGARWLLMTGRLAPSADLAAAQAELQTVVSAQQGRLASARATTETMSLLLLALVGVLLLLACANVAQILLARGLRRQQEIATRLARDAGSSFASC
jgi:hypothetical protein